MKNTLTLVFTVIAILVIVPLAKAQGFQKKIVIHWAGLQSVPGLNNESVKVLYAPELHYNFIKKYTPEFAEKFTLPDTVSDCSVLITHTEWEPVTQDELQALTFPVQPADTLSPFIETAATRNVKITTLSLVPLMVNSEGGIMRLKSFTIELIYSSLKKSESALKSEAYIANSVLSHGNWYKIQLDKTGIYKVTYADLKAMGIDMSTVTPTSIRLFGNGGGLLPEANNIFRYDDLAENAISVVTANSNVFAPGDYFLFYGTSPDKIVYNKTDKKFNHVKNIYSDFAYYYLNFDGAPGLRIADQPQSALTPTYTSDSFLEGLFYEKDLNNVILSGKDWVDKKLQEPVAFYELPEYTFANLKSGKQAWISYRVVASATQITDFTVSINGSAISNPSISPLDKYYLAHDRTEIRSFIPETDKVKISFKYNGTGTSIGWLDWVELNMTHDLIFTGGQMAFADPVSVANGRITKYQLQAATPATTIWEVTDPIHVKRINAGLLGNVSSFVLATDSLRQFVAWDNTSFLNVSFTEKVKNQNLHAITAADMLIVTHNDFIEHANRLAEHHRIVDGMRVSVVTNEQVYNEFSSGSPDIAAIRDFARMLYNRPGENNKLRYLLLFGDGSYDFKDRVSGNTNRVLTFQSKESLSSPTSYACDDFYGQLDANEGDNATGLIDIGIGRFPVNSVEQAKNAVDKCIRYALNSEESLGDWRNKICLVADDGDANRHFNQADQGLAVRIDELNPTYNLTKAYIDAYKQISTPIGERCPDANTVINTNVQNGVLIMNYTGHGGERGWADESILSLREINSWTNQWKLPVFITATCEFSRYDNPALVSAGELTFLNPIGGGIALFTTSRLASPGPNVNLNLRIYDTLFSRHSIDYPRFGDALSYAKNMASPSEITMIRNFVLLGDPALRLAYPIYNVTTTSVNGQNLIGQPDTISAMTPVEIKGIITNVSGNKINSYTGILDVKVFDKVRSLTTLGTTSGDWPEKYTVQDNLIYQGRASVTNGDFVVNFIVPRDIDYSYGYGKISYYASNGVIDASGYSNQLVIGGSGSESTDNIGPEIDLFINDHNFKDGGITGDTPLLIAQLSDESGISTISNAIGHDIVATLDGDNTTAVVLNSYYTADLDSYRSGVVKYKTAQLTEGIHTLTLKAWDVFNNSSEATISFEVSKNMQLTIKNMKVYPNPFRDVVNAEFEINLFDSPVEAHLEIYNSNGSLVGKTVSQKMLSQGYKLGPLTWDGKYGSGTKVVPGIYLISIRVSNGKSETVKAARLVRVR